MYNAFSNFCSTRWANQFRIQLRRDHFNETIKILLLLEIGDDLRLLFISCPVKNAFSDSEIPCCVVSSSIIIIRYLFQFDDRPVGIWLVRLTRLPHKRRQVHCSSKPKSPIIACHFYFRNRWIYIRFMKFLHRINIQIVKRVCLVGRKVLMLIEIISISGQCTQSTFNFKTDHLSRI